MQLTYPSATSRESQRFYDRHWVGRLVLALVCVVWGSTFALNKLALEHIGVFAFLALRFALAYVVMAIVGIWWYARHRGAWRTLLRPQRATLIPGVFLFLSYALQTLGLRQISPATSGFITGLSVVLVPLLGILFRQPIRARQAVASLVALVGLGLVSAPLGTGDTGGDLLTVGCAVAVALQILFTEGLVRTHRVPPFKLVLDQIFIVAVLSGALSLVLDTRPPSHSFSLATMTAPIVLIAIVVTAIFATAVAFVAQTHYQRTISSSELVIIFNLEPLFAFIFGVLLTATVPTALQLSGGAVIIAAMMISALGIRGAQSDLDQRGDLEP